MSRKTSSSCCSLSVSLACLGALVLLASPALADTVFLPESRHQAYATFGLFDDYQTFFLLRDSSRAWGGLAGTFALLGSDAPAGGQLVFRASIQSAFRLDASGINSETNDIRVSLLWQMPLGSDWLLSAGYEHLSGHAGDDILDADLLPVNVGIESVPVRFIYRGNKYFRPGATLQLIPAPAPATKLFQANEFVEIYPWGQASDPRHLTPFLAFGSEQYGRNSIDASAHGQVGIFFGNHLGERHMTSLRAVIGGYSGPDPRSKYYLYKNSYTCFVYSGISLDL